MATSSTLIPRTLAAARTRSTRTTISTSLPKAAMKTTCRSRWPGSATMIAVRPATKPIPTGRTGPRQLFNPRRSQVSTTLWPVVSTATTGHDRQLAEKFNRKVPKEKRYEHSEQDNLDHRRQSRHRTSARHRGTQTRSEEGLRRCAKRRTAKRRQPRHAAHAGRNQHCANSGGRGESRISRYPHQQRRLGALRRLERSCRARTEPRHQSLWRPRSPCHNRCALFWPDGALRYTWSCPAPWTRI